MRLPAMIRTSTVLIVSAFFSLGVAAPAEADDYKTTLAKAQAGDPVAQCNLGLMYDQGNGAPKDPATAVKWFRKSAELGNVRAQHNLGCAYEAGEGVPKDATKAARWYRKAADQGLALSQTNLGLLYYRGDGVPQDAAEAVREANDLTNELLKSNADNLQQANRILREEMERGVFDIESVRAANETLIATIEDSLRIADEGKSRRAAAETDLKKLETDLRDTLAAARARSTPPAAPPT